MAKFALVVAGLVLPLSLLAQVSPATPPTKAGPGTTLTGEDAILPAQTPITVKTKDAIDPKGADDRMYQATVESDVAGTKGRVMIPKGSDAKILIQRAGKTLSLDLVSVTIGDQTYALIASAGPPGNNANVPVDSVLTFRLNTSIMLLTPVK